VIIVFAIIEITSLFCQMISEGNNARYGGYENNTESRLLEVT